MKISEHDVASIIDWLVGKLKEGSADDLKARRALAKVLRYGPLDRRLLFILADLIDPDTRDDLSRWLVFKRAPGAKKTMDRSAIIWRQVKTGIKKEAAVADAMNKCNVRSRDKALAAYNEYRPIFEKWGSKIKALTQTD
jgi:hypothetical protein